MQLPIEVALRPNLHIRSHPGSPKSPISRVPPPETLWGFIGDNDHEVIIAVWASISTCHGAKEINPFRAVYLHQTADDFSEQGVLSRGLFHHRPYGIVPAWSCMQLRKTNCSLQFRTGGSD